MPTRVRFQIEMIDFRPVGSVTTCTVVMRRIDAPQKQVVEKVGNYFLRVKRPGAIGGDPAGPMELSFYMRQDTQFLLKGVTFSNRDPNAAGNRAGQTNFTRVVIERENFNEVLEPGFPNDQGNQTINNGPVNKLTLTITNQRQRHQGNPAPGGFESYDYLLLVQNVNTGEIGVIDPELENEA